MENSDRNRILHDLRLGTFKLTHHAKQRMDERGVTSEDIQRCAETAKRVEAQENGKYKIIGTDLSDELLKVVAAWDGETLVITVIGD